MAPDPYPTPGAEAPGQVMENWTHVRKLLGYERYDSPAALEAINQLYRNELRLLQNLFLPSVKLLAKKRVGSKLRRRYDRPQTPLERVMVCRQADPVAMAKLKALRDATDPFELSRRIDRQLERIFSLAKRARVVTAPQLRQRWRPMSPLRLKNSNRLPAWPGVSQRLGGAQRLRRRCCVLRARVKI